MGGELSLPPYDATITLAIGVIAASAAMVAPVAAYYSWSGMTWRQHLSFNILGLVKRPKNPDGPLFLGYILVCFLLVLTLLADLRSITDDRLLAWLGGTSLVSLWAIAGFANIAANVGESPEEQASRVEIRSWWSLGGSFLLSIVGPVLLAVLAERHGVVHWFGLGTLAVLGGLTIKELTGRLSVAKLILLTGIVAYVLLTGYQIVSLAGFLPYAGPLHVWGALAISVAAGSFAAFRFMTTASDGARKEAELKSARLLQLSLLPPREPLLPRCTLSWTMETATEVGGDYYDYSLTDDGTLTLCVGDATGHGMDSGVVVTGTKSLFQTFADAPSITDSLTVMSKSLKGMNMPRMGMAMTWLRVKDQTCTVSSAGMPPVMIYRASTGAVEEVEVAGFPLGVSASATYQEESFEVSPGDVILMMTDGLPERLNPRDEYFDYDRTTALFAEAASGTPEEICETLLKGGEDWAEGRPQDDDITLVVLKVK